MDDFSCGQTCPTSFSLHGTYRVQSNSNSVTSTLAGTWLDTAAFGCLDARQATRLAFSHPACVERDKEVTLAPAIILRRTGAFAMNDDALYYADHFVATDRTSPLQTDVLDVCKLQRLWAQRRKLLEPAVQPCAGMNLFGVNIVSTAIDEYMCHEAGHRLGMSVQSKQRRGYFRLGGKFRWPLVYLEEFRADINAWDLALANLDRARATNVISYTLLHRLGLAAQNLTQGAAGAGFVPFLDFTVAWRAGVVQVMPGMPSPIRLNFAASALARLRQEIRKVADRLNVRDVQPSELSEIAYRSMSCLDKALRDEAAVLAFRAAVLPAERVARNGAVPENEP